MPLANTPLDGSNEISLSIRVRLALLYAVLAQNIAGSNIFVNVTLQYCRKYKWKTESGVVGS